MESIEGATAKSRHVFTGEIDGSLEGGVGNSYLEPEPLLPIGFEIGVKLRPLLTGKTPAKHILSDRVGPFHTVKRGQPHSRRELRHTAMSFLRVHVGHI